MSTRDDELGRELEALKRIIGFMARAGLRHWRAIAACTALALLGGSTAVRLMPQKYAVQTRVLTDPGYLLAGLTSPNRRLPPSAQDATRGAVELIRSREGLEAIIDDAQLVETWAERRSPIRRALDELRDLVAAPLDEKELRAALLEMLEEHLWASVDGEVVQITASWHDREIATRIARVAQERFLQVRLEREVSEIHETITLLQAAVDEATPRVETSARVMRDLARKHDARIERRPRADANLPDLGSTELDFKTAELQAARSSYYDVARDARQRLTRLNSQLGPMHPDVLEARRALEGLSDAPPHLADLEVEVDNLRAKTRSERRRDAWEEVPVYASGSIDPELERAVREYRYEDDVHRDLEARLAGAQLELETAQSGFAYRYEVTQPPVPPRKPEGPPPALILVAAAVGGAVLGFAWAVRRDFESGIIIEAWQVPEKLDVPLLAQIERR